METVNVVNKLNKDKILTGDEREVCHIQGVLFGLCQNKLQCDAFDFATKFMNSAIAADMDTNGSRYYIRDAFELTDSLRGMFAVLPLSDRKDPFALEWVGYMYRYWAWLGMSSKEIIRMVPVERAYPVYLGLHTLDVRHAISSLIESSQLRKQIDK
jgi:hypothetical protein